MSAFERAFAARLESPYAVAARAAADGPGFIAAPEAEGPVLKLTLRDGSWTADTVLPGPGGCMSLIPEPGRPGSYLSIMQCYPGYRFAEGGVYRITENASGTWSSSRIADLPFAHRIETVPAAGGYHLIAATIAAWKESPEDWSQPGVVYHAFIDSGAAAGPGETLTPVLEGLHHNHGMLRTTAGDIPVVLVSGDEGVFALSFEGDTGEGSAPRAAGPLLGRPTSEVAVLDLDRDGAGELLTIEPFHGERIAMYTQSAGAGLLEPGSWREVWSTTAAFGHGMWAGELGGEHAVLVSNRSEDGNLRRIRSVGGQVMDEALVAGVHAANVAVLHADGTSWVAATEQATDEVAVYALR